MASVFGGGTRVFPAHTGVDTSGKPQAAPECWPCDCTEYKRIEVEVSAGKEFTRLYRKKKTITNIGLVEWPKV